MTPHEVYDKVVVIDAGHGGNARELQSRALMKDIDLAIVLKVKELFDQAGDKSVGVYYTRTDDSNPSLEQRVDMANKAGQTSLSAYIIILPRVEECPVSTEPQSCMMKRRHLKKREVCS